MSQLKGRKWHVQAAVAIRGEGLYEGLDWCDSPACSKIPLGQGGYHLKGSVCLAGSNMCKWRADVLQAVAAYKIFLVAYSHVAHVHALKSASPICRLASTLKSMQRSGQITNVSAAGR